MKQVDKIITFMSWNGYPSKVVTQYCSTNIYRKANFNCLLHF